jgi:DNA-binding LacI/PurR family transcriptional regulator
MKDPYRLPNINDIAKEAGVSKSTVSRALANSKSISEKTKQKILSIKDRLGYEPNNIARGLSIKKTYTIGVLLEDISNSFYTEMARGIEVTLKKAGYTMFLASTDFSCDEEMRLTKTFIQNGVDGILITLINEHSEVLNVLKKRELPFFVLNGKPCDESINWIDTDNRLGGYLQAKHLIDTGHRKFIILRSTQLEGSRDRFTGIVEAFAENGVSMDDQVVLGDANTREDGYALIKDFFEKGHAPYKPTAVIATNDIVAME